MHSRRKIACQSVRLSECGARLHPLHRVRRRRKSLPVSPVALLSVNVVDAAPVLEVPVSLTSARGPLKCGAPVDPASVRTCPSSSSKGDPGACSLANTASRTSGGAGILFARAQTATRRFSPATEVSKWAEPSAFGDVHAAASLAISFCPPHAPPRESPQREERERRV